MLVVLYLTGCDAYVDKAKYDASEKETADLKKQVADLQEQVADCKAHKYEIFHQGYRTWRLDTVSGSTCILLTTPEDWKIPHTALQGCGQ